MISRAAQTHLAGRVFETPDLHRLGAALNLLSTVQVTRVITSQ